jgi:hypothetical protein
MTAKATRQGGFSALLGAVGLLLTPIAATLLLMSLGTDRHDAFVLFALLTVGLVLWGQAVGRQAALPFPVTAEWMVTVVVLFFVVLVAGLITGVLAGVGLVGSAVAAGLLSFFSARLEAGSVRAATLRALWHAILGRATDVDRAFLSAGPGGLLRG